MALFQGRWLQIFVLLLISANGLIPSSYAQSDINFKETNPVTVFLAIDGSATMSGSSIEAVKNFSKCFIEELRGRNNKQDKIGIVVWNTTINKNLLILPTINFADVSIKLDKIKPAGNTCLAVGLDYAISNLNTNSAKILFLTDGNQDCSLIEDCKSVMRKANDNNISVYTILVGKNCSSNFKEMGCLRDLGHFKCMPNSITVCRCAETFLKR